MLNKLLNYFIHRKLLVNLLIITTIIFGVFSVQSLRRESMPEVDLYKIYYQTIYPSAAPEDVELKVTIPIEDAIKEVDDIKEYYSTSYENRSIVQVTLEDYLTDDEAEDIKRDIQKAVDTVDLPKEVKNRPEFFELKTSKMPVIEVALSHPDYQTLRGVARFLEQKIERLSDVSKVSKSGYLDREVKIQLDPVKLIETETPVEDVVSSLRGTSVRMSSGKIKNYEREKSIIVDEEFKKDGLIKDAIVRASFGNKILRVSDIGSVKDAFEDPNTYIRFNGLQGISLSIVKKENADAIRTINKVKELLDEQKEYLPKGLVINMINDTSTFTKNRIKIVIVNALMGLVLVLISLKVFLDFRTAAWTAFGIPFSLLVSFAVLKLINVSINPISLGGFIIVIGMLVDDAIVVAENIKRHIEEKEEVQQAVKDGVSEVAMPVITTIATTIIAFLPLMFVPGIMGKFMKIMPIVVIVTLSASLIESLFILPSHLDHKKKAGKKQEKKKWVKNLELSYKKVLTKVVNFRYAFLLFGIIVFIATIIFATKAMKFELFPSGDADSFSIKIESADSTSLDKMSDLVKNIENSIEKIPSSEISSYKVIIGQDSDNSFGSNLAYVSVFLTPKEERKYKLAKLFDTLRADFKEHEKLFKRITFEQKHMGPPVGRPVDVSVISDNDEQRKLAGAELMQYVENLPGILDPKDNKGEGVSEYRLVINNEKIVQLGLSVLNVANTVRTAYEGNNLFELRRNNEDVTYKVIFADKYRKDMSYLLDLPIRNKQGQLIRVRNFAKLREVESTLKITRFNGQRAYSIYADLDVTKLTSMQAKKLITKFYNEHLAKKYPTANLYVSGEATRSQESIISLAKTFLIAIVGIYFVLILLFNSMVQPIFVLSAIPFAFIGVVWAFYFHGQNFSFPAAMGIIGLCGVVVNDSLIMVNYINLRNKKAEGKKLFVENVIIGATTRLRPIILTTVTTVLGLLPTIYGWGGTDFILVPMTMSLGYGLAFATVVTLFFVPCLTVIYYDVKHLAWGYGTVAK
jgi:multidrug efflux pump subunit AcrB